MWLAFPSCPSQPPQLEQRALLGAQNFGFFCSLDATRGRHGPGQLVTQWQDCQAGKKGLRMCGMRAEMAVQAFYTTEPARRIPTAVQVEFLLRHSLQKGY